jgi:hypothetical protein
LQILRFGSDAVMLHPNPIPHLIQQPWRRWCRRRFVRHGSFQQVIRNQDVTSILLLLYTTLAGSRHLSGCLLNVRHFSHAEISSAVAHAFVYGVDIDRTTSSVLVGIRVDTKKWAARHSACRDTRARNFQYKTRHQSGQAKPHLRRFANSICCWRRVAVLCN